MTFSHETVPTSHFSIFWDRLRITKQWGNGHEKVLKSMQAHGFRKSSVGATQWAFLGDAIFASIPLVHTSLTTYYTFATPCKYYRWADGGMLAYVAFESLAQLTLQGCWDFQIFTNFMQVLHVLSQSTEFLFNINLG